MLDRVAHSIARHRMFSPGQRLGVAVSGGADSVFLLHALGELAPRWNLQLSVTHIDHGIRGPASQADAEFVAQLAATLASRFTSIGPMSPPWKVTWKRPRGNIRQAFYAELIASGAVDRVATGHTRTDQAETVLYRILRGSGLSGLFGILPVTAKDSSARSSKSIAPKSKPGCASKTSPGARTQPIRTAPTPAIVCATTSCRCYAKALTRNWTPRYRISQLSLATRKPIGSPNSTPNSRRTPIAAISTLRVANLPPHPALSRST